MPNNFLNPDSINTPSTIFNQPGDVWGNNEAPATVPLNTYYRVPQPNSAPITPDFATPQILTIPGQTLAATPDDVASTTTIPQPAAPTAIPTTPVVAPYSIARGLSILDQYRSGFWTTSDAIETIAASMATATAMDPTPAELVDAWTNFQDSSHIAVPKWNWLVKLASNRSERCQQSVGFDFIENLTHFVGLFSRFFQQIGFAEFDKHPLGPCRNQADS